MYQIYYSYQKNLNEDRRYTGKHGKKRHKSKKKNLIILHLTRYMDCGTIKRPKCVSYTNIDTQIKKKYTKAKIYEIGLNMDSGTKRPSASLLYNYRYTQRKKYSKAKIYEIAFIWNVTR